MVDPMILIVNHSQLDTHQVVIKIVEFVVFFFFFFLLNKNISFKQKPKYNENL
jgi:hypothetical protein